jgi:DNA helicase HerA-like ATPase
MTAPMLIAKAESEVVLLPQLANRHGLIAGATGTGKTVTLQRLAESFSAIGVPVFLADVKGDLTGISQAGGKNRAMRINKEDISIVNVKRALEREMHGYIF